MHTTHWWETRLLPIHRHWHPYQYQAQLGIPLHPTYHVQCISTLARRMEFFHLQSLKTIKEISPIPPAFLLIILPLLETSAPLVSSSAQFSFWQVQHRYTYQFWTLWEKKPSILSIPCCCSFSIAPKAKWLSNCRLQEQETALVCIRLIFRKYYQLHIQQLLWTHFITPKETYISFLLSAYTFCVRKPLRLLYYTKSSNKFTLMLYL